MKNVHPRKLILNMIARKCEKCKNIQYVFFMSQKEFNEWECPVCKFVAYIVSKNGDFW